MIKQLGAVLGVLLLTPTNLFSNSGASSVVNDACVENAGLKELRGIMVNGDLTERERVLKKLVTIHTGTSFDIAAIELKNKRYINLIREATGALIRIDVGKAIRLLKTELSKGAEGKRLDILLGTSDVDTPRSAEILVGFSPMNSREEVISAYVQAKGGINYGKNFELLTQVVSDKAKFLKGSPTDQLACDDAAVFLGKLRNPAALPILRTALKWADGVLGEDISESIQMIEEQRSRSGGRHNQR